MIGLSLTAIGQRTLDESLTIEKSLREALGIQFLELAVGVECPVWADYGERPLVLHDSCLRDERGRRRLDPLTRSTWETYRRFIEANDVLAVGVHAPPKRRCTLSEFEVAVQAMEQELGVPVSVEVMPDPGRWCSSEDTIADTRLLVDVSHVLIWHGGDEVAAERSCRRLLETHCVGEIHLSHNDGKRDSHELIPPGRWFAQEVDRWAESMLVTFESLPFDYAAFERIDKQRTRWAHGLC